MKTLLITDMHGKDPTSFISRAVKSEGIEKLVVLGDLDTPDVLKSIQTCADNCNLNLTYVVGNHEYHYVRRQGISGGSMYKDVMMHDFLTGKDRVALAPKFADEYFDEWAAAPEQKQFVLDASTRTSIDFPKTGLIVPDNEIVYAHASLLDKDRTDPDSPDIVWGFIAQNATKLRENFEAMACMNDFRLFFRGHDHFPTIRTSNDGTIVKGFDNVRGKFKVDLENTRTIATIGAFLFGNYAVYDSETQEIDFRRFRVKDKSKWEIVNF